MKLAALIPFIFLSIFVISVLSSPALAYYDLNATDDAYTRSFEPAKNFGTSVAATISQSINWYITGGVQYGFIAFDMTEISYSETISNASLSLSVHSFDAYNISVYNTTYFSETNITYNNQPLNDTLQINYLLGSQNEATYDYVVLDVTTSAQSAHENNETLYLMIRPTDLEQNTTIYDNAWWSKELGVHYPYLRIDTLSGEGCSSYDDGSWCDDYDLRRPCCYSETISDYLFMEPPQCTFDTSNCYDLYGEVPNMVEDLGTGFTVYNSSVESCIQEYSSCPAGYLCSQFYNSETHLFEGKVSCYGTATGEWVYYNESGDAFNGTEYIESYSTCDTFNAWIYNNSWSCRINDCQWCPLALTCIGTEGDCSSLITSSNCTNSSTVCYNQYCNIVSCTTNNIQTWAQSFNRGTGVPIASEILAFVLALGFGMFIFLKTKSKTLETFLVPFLSIVTIFCLPGIEFIPVWVLLLEAMMIFVLVFFKVKG